MGIHVYLLSAKPRVGPVFRVVGSGLVVFSGGVGIFLGVFCCSICFAAVVLSVEPYFYLSLLGISVGTRGISLGSRIFYFISNHGSNGEIVFGDQRTTVICF